MDSFQKNNMNRTDLIKLTGINQTAWLIWGKTNISMKKLEKICRAMNLILSDISEFVEK